MGLPCCQSLVRACERIAAVKQTEPNTPAVEAKWRALADALKAEVSAMLGMPALESNGKAFAGLFGIKLEGAELFDPSGMGRPMKARSEFGKAALGAQRRAK
jgi:hypothetical protein